MNQEKRKAGKEILIFTFLLSCLPDLFGFSKPEITRDSSFSLRMTAC